MFKRENRLTNLYYSEYVSDSDNEIVYDSESSLSRMRLSNSPRFASWCKFMSEITNKDQSYEAWKSWYRASNQMRSSSTRFSGWKVLISSTVVWLIYKPKINGVRVKGFTFRLMFEYMRILQKWYLSRGCSFLPDVINLGNKFHKGLDDPFDQQVKCFLKDIRKIINYYMARRQYVDEVIETIENNYRDLAVEFNKQLDEVILIFKADREGVWIPDQEKSTQHDCIKIQIQLDKDFVAIPDGIGFSYKVRRNLDIRIRRRLKQSLESKLDVFYRLSLKPAFAELMREN